MGALVRPAAFTALAQIAMVSAEPERLVQFLAEGLGFEPKGSAPVPPSECALLGVASVTRQALVLGQQRVAIDRFPEVRPYPNHIAANDPRFQHFAIVTSDIAAAWARAKAAGARPISHDGPVQLPLASGGAIAIKFRDPDGHPLELLQFSGAARADWRGSGNLGIDHSAIVVANCDRSLAFYNEHGLAVVHRSLNHGVEQQQLDNLTDAKDSAEVKVIAMQSSERGPKLELLSYAAISGGSTAKLVSDTSATRLIWHSSQNELLQDPDGHFHQLSLEQ